MDSRFVRWSLIGNFGYVEGRLRLPITSCRKQLSTDASQ
jgi:hypothetical protein